MVRDHAYTDQQNLQEHENSRSRQQAYQYEGGSDRESEFSLEDEEEEDNENVESYRQNNPVQNMSAQQYQSADKDYKNLQSIINYP